MTGALESGERNGCFQEKRMAPMQGAHCLRISCRGVTGASHLSWQFVAGAPGSGGDVGAERYS